MLLRAATLADLESIEAIYGHYVETSTCTFQTTKGTLDERRAWFADRGPEHPVLVAEEAGEVAAWGALSRYHRREAYAPTVEDSIYVRHDLRGRGHGRALLRALVARAEEAGLHSVLGIIAADQPGSLRLHEAEGFVQVGLIREAGFKMGRWIDVAFLQRMLR
jgi:phosphinothricin acetyltransferase